MKKLNELKNTLMVCGQKILKMVIPDEPIPQARVRFGRGGHAYEPAKCTKAKNDIKEIAEQIMIKENFPIAHKDMPVAVDFWFYKSIPTSYPPWKKMAAKYGLIAPTTKKGDIDNLVKLALDGINGVVMYDDCQVVEIHAYSRYSTEPRTEIVVKSLFVNVGDVKSKIKILKEAEKSDIQKR